MSIGKKEETQEVRRAALTFLEEHKKMILTILDKEGFPNSSLVLYAVDDFNIYFGTRKAFGKYSALKADPHVAVAVVQENIDPLQVLDMQGIAEEVPEEKLEETLHWFTEKNTSEFYVKDAEDFVMFKITPTCLRWLDAVSGDLQICDLSVQHK